MIYVGEECLVVVAVVQGFAGEFVGSGLEMCAVNSFWNKTFLAPFGLSLF